MATENYNPLPFCPPRITTPFLPATRKLQPPSSLPPENYNPLLSEIPLPPLDAIEAKCLAFALNLKRLCAVANLHYIWTSAAATWEGLSSAARKNPRRRMEGWKDRLRKNEKKNQEGYGWRRWKGGKQDSRRKKKADEKNG